MKREFLKSLELSDEVIDKIMAENGNDINGLKAKQTELESQINDYKTQVAERDKQLETLKKSAGDSESLKEQIGKLQEENKASAEKFEAQLRQVKIDSAVEIALTSAKAKNAKAVRALLDLVDAKLEDDGTVKGLDKQIEALKSSDEYLFETVKTPDFKGVKPGESPEGKPAGQKSIKDMNYSELAAYMEANPGAI